MTDTAANMISHTNGLLDQVRKHRHLLVPVSFLLLIVVLVVPLPPSLIDVLLSINLSLAAVILVSTISMTKPLDFSVFPALLLATTLFRLVLNVATTRLILTADADSPAEATAVAGHVIEAFGVFVAGQSILVGLVIFTILVVVQFVVVTKGATRMSEVAARFTLDAMPGKQMAIDSDLSAGLIDEAEAQSRRKAITEEADFYGAMDGASKFVRGDAIAAIIITLVNIAGGFAIGAFEKGWTIRESFSVFTRLTIGDGLVTQIPAFIIAIAVGLIISRTSSEHSIGEEIPKQLSSQPTALWLIAGFLVLLSLTPLPTIPLLAAAVLIAAVAWAIRFAALQEQAKESAQDAQRAADGLNAPSVEELLNVEALEVEIGYGLVQLVDPSRNGDLLERIATARRQLASELGFIVPPIRIRDNMQLDANHYRIKLRAAVIGEGDIYPSRLMAMETHDVTDTLDDPQVIPGTEPAFGLDALWIEPEMRPLAESRGYTLVDAPAVLATHLTELAKSHADELLSREDVNHLLEQLKKTAPKLVEETVPAVVKVGELQKVLQNLLRERIPIRDLGAILESLGDWAPHTRNLDLLTEHARHALRRTISNMFAVASSANGGKATLHCVTVDAAVEDFISRTIDEGDGGMYSTMLPDDRVALVKAVERAAEPLLAAGHRLIILTTPGIRPHLKRLLNPHMPHVVVLSYNEIVSGLDVESMGLVQCNTFRQDGGAHADSHHTVSVK